MHLPMLHALKANRSALWDAANKSANINLSADALTASNTSGGWNGVRGTVGVDSGKWYWEVKLIETPAVTHAVGVCDAACTLTGKVLAGDSQHNWVTIINGASSTRHSPSVNYGAYDAGSTPAGCVIGHLLDRDAGTLAYTVNGVNKGVAFNDVNVLVYPIVFFVYANSAKANFGSSPFAYPVPDGYTALAL